MPDIEILCKHCDHFVDQNAIPPDATAVTNPDGKTITVTYPNGTTAKLAKYVHMEDGEQEFDHDAEPGEARADWKTHRPDLFKKYPDGSIGPNSEYHSQRGKRNSHLYEDGDVLCLNEAGHVVQWQSDGDYHGPYTSGESLEEFGVANLTDAERSRVGLS